MKLGMVTYQIAKDWDVPTLIDKCTSLGYQGVELRTTHAHGVEVSLSSQERSEVRKQFEDSGIEIAGLGSTFEFHAVEPEVVRENIEGTIEAAKLAADVGCSGVKVRPNGLQVKNGISAEKTLEQIGRAVGECAKVANDLGVQIRVEVHGNETKDPKNMKVIMDHADHANAYACWNSNDTDVINGSITENFNLLKDKIGLVHITEMHNESYPWQDLFDRLKAENYSGFTLAEIPASPEADRLLSYYRALWKAYTA